MMNLIYVLLFVNGISAVLVYAIVFAFFQRAFPTLATEDLAGDRMTSLTVALLTCVAGPFAVVIVFVMCEFGRYGLRFR